MVVDKINWRPESGPASRPYINEVPNFVWVSVPKEGICNQASGWHTCRETFCEEIKKSTTKGVWIYPSKIDFKKLSLVTVKKCFPPDKKDDISEEVAKDLQCKAESVRVLNIIERHLGWTLTKLSQCNDDELKNHKLSGFIFTGSPKWLKAPQLLSLYLLIIRLGYFQKELSVFKNVEDLSKVLREFNKSFTTYDTYRRRDIDWFKRTHKMWYLMLRNYSRLFGSRHIKRNYKISNYGIDALAKNVGNKDLVDRWLDVKKEASSA